ncbi:hypothetical protein ASZ90_020269 [hydrocarbon metagenome]|uniref:Uncharacterized protein n=1 Tax=hydrocarbon metagenome TaxID=938273 RepID=A0A0W8E137_9ZZZZ
MEIVFSPGKTKAKTHPSLILGFQTSFKMNSLVISLRIHWQLEAYISRQDKTQALSELKSLKHARQLKRV